jgi:sugar lactone lactonase YvrE
VRLAVLALALVAIGLLPAGASARTTRLFEGSLGPLAQGPTKQLTVDQSSGDVYAVFDYLNDNKVARFDSTGAAKNFTAGPNAGTNTLTGFAGVADVAIDNSGGPLDGDIYVLETNASFTVGAIGVFAANGERIGTLTGSNTTPGQFGRPTGLAVDQSNGSVYIPDGNTGTIWRFAPNSPGESVDDADYAVTGIKLVCPSGTQHLAVGAGSLYMTRNFGNGDTGGRVCKVPTSTFASNPPPVAGEILEVEGAPLRAGALSVDPKDGNLYALESNRVAVFDPSGALLYRFGASAYFGEKSKAIAAKSAGSGPAAKVYVAAGALVAADRKIKEFGPLTHAIVRTHPAIAAFGKDGSAGSSFEPLKLESLAFDQAAGRLYAADQGNPGIYGFDASSPPVFPLIGAFSPLAVATGFQPGLAVDNTGLGSAGNVYLASRATNLLYGFDSTGAPLGGSFPIDPATSPGGPSGSPSDLGGVAVDSAGNVWVANRATKRILEYSSTGAYLSSLDVSARGIPNWIAFDGDDDIYVALNFGEAGVWKYPAPGYGTSTRADADAPSSEEISGIAVDPSTHNLYVAGKSRIDEYDSAGSFLDEFATGIPAPGFSTADELMNAEFGGLTVDPANHYVYASDRTNGKIRVFGPGVILPDLALERPSGLTDTTATLHAGVGTQTVALTDCHFEYVAEADFRLTGFSDLSSGGSVPCGSVPVDLEDHAVSVPVSGLSPNTTYSFRLLAANAEGSATTPAQTFTSLGPPLAETTGSPVRSVAGAELLGRVDPSNSATSFHFEYGAEGPCDANPCDSTEAVSAGSGGAYELAAARVSGLQPETTYHYRIVADNGTPGSPAFGEDMTVTTRASDAPLSHGHFPGPPGSDRAYEQVSLPDSGGNPVKAGVGFSDNGERAVYETSGGNPSSPIGGFRSIFVGERSETAPHTGAWKAVSVMPARGELAGSNFNEPTGPSDLSSFAIGNFAVAATRIDVWQFSPEAPAKRLFQPVPPQKYFNWYVGSDDSTRTVAFLQGGTLDPAYPSATALGNLYDVSSGTPKLASLLPGNVVSSCELKGLENTEGRNSRNWISADGKLLFFHSCDNLYMREFEAEQTKLVSGPPLSGPQCPAVLIKSTPGAAFFWTQTRLVAEDTVPAGCIGESTDGDIYRYDTASGAEDCVTCLVAGLDADALRGSTSTATGPAEATAVAENGSRVYFQSPHRLAAGAPSSGGLYRVDVATGDARWIAGGDGTAGDVPSNATAINRDGAVIVFRAEAPGLDPLGEGSDNGGHLQYYRYDDRDRSLVCVSCPPDGSAAAGDVPREMLSSFPEVGANTTPLADDGSFAFRTTEALTGADQNTTGVGQDSVSGTDLYEWRDGKLLLVTDGLTDWPSSEPPILNAISPSGRDVFFTVAAQYTHDALDAYNRLYDARIGGGFEFPPPPKPCPLEVCQGTPKGAPEEQPSGTANFAGPGNLAGATEAKKKSKKKAHKKKSHKKAHQKKRHNRANDNRRTAR